jgi:hypothetical protein
MAQDKVSSSPAPGPTFVTTALLTLSVKAARMGAKVELFDPPSRTLNPRSRITMWKDSFPVLTIMLDRTYRRRWQKQAKDMITSLQIKLNK